MNFFKKVPPVDVPAPEAGDAEKLYQKLMPELGMKAKTPTQRRKYHNASLTRFMLPKAERIYLICVIAFVFLLLLSLPAKVKDVVVDTSTADSVDVSFRVTPIPFMDTIHAYINNESVAVTREDGYFHIQAEKNGQLILSVRTFMGRVTMQAITINSVDDRPPRILDHYNQDGTIFIFLADDGSGVDWKNITAVDSNTGVSVPLSDIDEAEGYICLPFPGGSITILAPDRSGNVLTAMLELVQE